MLVSCKHCVREIEESMCWCVIDTRTHTRTYECKDMRICQEFTFPRVINVQTKGKNKKKDKNTPIEIIHEEEFIVEYDRKPKPSLWRWFVSFFDSSAQYGELQKQKDE